MVQTAREGPNAGIHMPALPSGSLRERRDAGVRDADRTNAIPAAVFCRRGRGRRLQRCCGVAVVAIGARVRMSSVVDELRRRVVRS